MKEIIQASNHNFYMRHHAVLNLETNMCPELRSVLHAFEVFYGERLLQRAFKYVMTRMLKNHTKDAIEIY